MSTKDDFKSLFAEALQAITGVPLGPDQGISSSELDKCELRLGLKLPPSLRLYYEVAGKHPINLEHNRLYKPQQLDVVGDKLVFMEENQIVVFWAVALGSHDPEVFQATREVPSQWYSEEMKFSAWMIKMLRWQRGLDSDPVR